MKTSHLIFLCLFIFSVNVYGQLTEGLKAYYPFGGDISDQSGNGNTGALVGAPILTPDRFGFEQCAYFFPGTSTDYIKIDYSPDFNIDPNASFSISLWYQGGTENEVDIETLFDKHNPNVSPYPSDYHIILYDLNQPGLGSNYDFIVAAIGPPPIPDPNWHHVVGIYDNRNWSFFEDNIFRQEDTSRMYSIFQSTGGILIGKDFEGAIDDIRFYDRKLSIAEINEIYHLPSSCAATLINENSIEPVKLYPNPSNHLININIGGNNSIQNIFAFNIIGKLVISKINCHSSEEQLDILNLPGGLYFFQIQTDKGVVTLSFDKQK